MVSLACLAAAGLLPLPPLHPIGSKESLFSSTITASEEAMTVLEEVIMYTFQQCVYYISKVGAHFGGGGEAASHRASRSIPSSSRAAQEVFSFFFLSFYSLAVASHRGVFLWAEVPRFLVAAQEKY